MRKIKIITGVLLVGVLFSFSTGRKPSSPPIKQQVVNDSVPRKAVVEESVIKDSIPPLTRENLKKELIRQEIPHPEIVFNQAILETGNFTSVLCRKYNNLFGIRHGKPYAHYSNWIESVADYKKRISSRYKGGDYYAFLDRIKYAIPGVYTGYLKRMS